MKRSDGVRLAGEFGIIVVGVLTALTLESGWQRWQELRDEDLYVQALRAEVAENIAALDRVIQNAEGARAGLLETAHHLASGDSDAPSDSIVERRLFIGAAAGLFPDVSRVVLSEVTGAGSVGLISDDALRRNVQRGYANLDANLARLETNTDRYGGGLLNLLAGYGLGPSRADRPRDREASLQRLVNDPLFGEEVDRAVVRLDYAASQLRFARRAMEALLGQLDQVVDG
jgi:hypothetical protein